MNCNLQIRTLDQLQKLVDNCQSGRYNWKGDKLFIYDNNKTVSFHYLIQKLEKIFHSEYFIGAQISENDCKSLKEIKNKIELLDSQNIMTNKLQDFYLSFIKVVKAVISIIKPIFSLTIEKNKKDVLFEEIAQKSQKPSEALLLYDDIKTSLTPQIKHALQYSYDKYYKKPFKDSHLKSREAMCTIQGEIIHKYNHGLAHTIRKTFFIPFVIEYLERHGTDHLVDSLQELISKEGIDKFTKKLQLVTTFEVAGRESECGSRDIPQIYTSYLKNSSIAFKDYCKNQQLVGKGRLFEDIEDVKNYMKAIENKYHNRFESNKMDAITAVLDITHTLDEFRCYWPSRMKDELETVNHYYTKNKNNRDLWELAIFCQKTVKATGDRLMTEFSEGFYQRNRPFALSNLKSVLFRNFTFTNEDVFLNCSNDIDYCWNLLKKVSKPISYSKGETTFSYLSKESNKSFTDLSIKAKDALKIISEEKAVIRLVNTKAKKFGFEMEMINNPVFFRPVRPVKAERDWVLIDRINGIMYSRKFKDRLPLKTQIDNFKFEYPEDHSTWKPVHRSNERGLPKFTEDTKKLSFCLLRSDGKINHFKGEFPNEYGRYKPIGFLYNIEEVNQKKQKYIFDQDVGTTSKFWIGKDANKKITQKIGRNTSLRIEELQKKLKEEVDESLAPNSLPFYKMQHATNELLVCHKKSAIRAIFATENMPQARLQALLHAIYLAQDYGIHVPTLVIDGKNSPKSYLKKDLKYDLKKMLSSQITTLRSSIIRSLYFCFFSKLDNPINQSESLGNELFKRCSPFLSD